jgi:arsenate reductase
VVEYLKTGWTAAQLTDLFARMGVKPREVMRVRGTPAQDLGLTKPGASDAAILKAMTEHPVLVERPIVVTDKGAALIRPMERLEALL